MARTKRSAKLDSKKRLGLEPGKRHMDRISEGQYLIYQRPQDGSTGSWLARSYDKPTGKQVQIRLGSADDFSDPDGASILTFAQAQQKAKDWFDECDKRKRAALKGEAISVGPYTVANAIHDYLEDGKRRGMKALERTEQAARAHILPELGAIEVSKLTRAKIESWQRKLSESSRRVRSKKGSESPTYAEPPKTADEKRARKDTANRILTILKAALNHAMDRGKVVGSGDAWRAVKPYRGVTSSRIRYLTIEEQQRLVNSCPPDFKLLVQAALFTGARYGELTRLTVQDFDPQAGTIHISESKSGKSREVYLKPESTDWFKTLVPGKASSDLLFTRNGVKRRGRGESMENTSAWSHADQKRPMMKACTLAELVPISFHELRHTYASTLVNNTVAMAFVADQLGHSGTRMVEKHYGHLAPNAIGDAIRKLAPDLGIT